MTYEEYITCKTRKCYYAANPGCPNHCGDCIYRYKQDEKLGLGNNLTPKTGSFIGWKIVRLEQHDHTITKYDLDQCSPRGTECNCPATRTFVLPDGTTKECRFALVRLQIPEDAKRSSAYGKKCRCSKAQVLDIWPLGPVFDSNGEVIAYEVYGFLDAEHGHSWWNPSFEYRKGETVSVQDFDEHWWDECSSGIHFFMSTYDALRYVKEID